MYCCSSVGSKQIVLSDEPGNNKPVLEVIKLCVMLNSIEHDIRTAHKAKMLKTHLDFKPPDGVFIMLINYKQDKFHAHRS